MKKISEKFSGINITDYISESMVFEGIADNVISKIKEKFGKVISFMKELVAKVGNIYVVISKENGEVIPAVPPMTSASLYKDGKLDHTTTFVHPSPEVASIVGLDNDCMDVVNEISVYADYKKDPVKYFEEEGEGTNESNATENENQVNEVKLQASNSPGQEYVIKEVSDLAEEMKTAIEYKDIPLLIWGAPGIGKTAIVEEVANYMKKEKPNFQFETKVLADMVEGDLKLPVYSYDELGNKVGKKDVLATWLHCYERTDDKEENKRRSDACGEGVIFIDELSRANKKIQDTMLALLQSRRVDEFNLGDGWTIIAATNRPGDDPNSEEINKTTLNRFNQVWYEPTLETWMDWAKTKKYISPLLLSWLQGDGNKYFYYDPEEEDPNAELKMLATPRSWDNAMKNLARYTHSMDLEGIKILDIPTDKLKRILSKTIPPQAIESFVTFLKLVDKLGSVDKLVEDIWSGRETKEISQKDIKMLTLALCQMIFAYKHNELPTEEEFKHAAEWVVKQNNAQLASFFIDNFLGTYLSGISSDKNEMNSNLQQYFIAWKHIADSVKNRNESSYNRAVKALDKELEKFHTSILDEDFPDYQPGIRVLGKKYGEVLEKFGLV